MLHVHLAAGLAQEASQRLGHGDRAVTPSGAADPDRQIGLPLGVVEVVGVTFFLNEYTDPDRKVKAAEGLDLPVHFSGHVIVNSFGEGISHISFETTDLDYMMQQAEDAGMEAKFGVHRDALEGVCNFIQPNDARIPIEFMQAVEGRDNPLA